MNFFGKLFGRVDTIEERISGFEDMTIETLRWKSKENKFKKYKHPVISMSQE